MPGSSSRLAVIAVCLLLIGLPIAAIPATAADQSALGDILEPGEIDSGVLASGVGGWFDRLGYWWQSNLPTWVEESVPGLGVADANATAIETQVRSFYNARNESFEAYVNNRTNVSSNRVIAITYEVGDESASHYLLTNASEGELVNSTIVSTTGRETTDTVTVCRLAARDAPEQLERFHEEFVAPGQDVSTEYLAEIDQKYSKDVATPLFPTEGTCGTNGGDL